METTLSSKSKRKSTSFNEKFDGDNIAKFLTGEYSFKATSGGNTKKKGKTVRSKVKEVSAKATKISPLEQTDAMSEMLGKILTFMQKTHESDIKARELLNNYREENELENAKRHKELLDALKNIKPTTKEEKTAEKLEQDTGSGPMSIIESILEAFGGVKTGLKLMGKLGKFFVATPLGIAILAATTLLELLNNDKNPEATTKVILGAMDPTTVGTEIMNANEQLGEQSVEDYNKMLEQRRTALKDAPLLTKFYGSESAQREYLQSIGMKQEEIDNLFSETRKRPPKPIVGATTEVAAKARADFAKTDERMKLMSEPTPTMEPPPVSTDIGDKLSSISSENELLPLMEQVQENITTNINNSTSTQPTEAPFAPIPLVRNQEPTYMRMIYQSTRVV